MKEGLKFFGLNSYPLLAKDNKELIILWESLILLDLLSFSVSISFGDSELFSFSLNRAFIKPGFLS